MSVWAAIPLRGFALAKSRLAGVLEARERLALNRDFFQRVTAAAVEVLGAARVLVVSPDAAVIEAARARRLAALREPAGIGLNAALVMAGHACEAGGATAVLSLSCDLPCLVADDIDAALQAWTGAGAVALAPDESGSGTNALVVPTGAGFSYQMGPGSSTRHRHWALRTGLGLIEIHRPGLAFDVDTPDDLARWRGMQGGARKSA